MSFERIKLHLNNIQNKKSRNFRSLKYKRMKVKTIGIIGAGGHGKVVADIAKNFYDKIVFFDDTGKESCLDYKVIGKIEDVVNYINEMDFFIAIGDSYYRKIFFDKLVSLNGKIATLIHPKSTIAKGVQIGKGSLIVAGAIINSATKIGEGVIINTASSVDHDCIIGDFSHIAVGACIAGTVKIGKNVWIGAGAIVVNDIELCDDCFIGAGAVVVKDIKEKGLYIGIPAKKRSDDIG